MLKDKKPEISESLMAPGIKATRLRIRAYILAILLTAAIFFLRMVLSPWVGDRPVLILFIIPMVLSAYWGGLGSGLLCTALIGLSTTFFFMPARLSFAFERPLDLAQWLLLIVIGVIISVLASSELVSKRNDVSEALNNRYASTERKVQGAFALALACLGLIVVVSFLSVVRLAETTASVDHSHEVINGLESLFSKVSDSQNGRRGFMVTGDDTYLEPYFEAAKTAVADANQLRELTKDNPQQQQRITELIILINAQLNFDTTIINTQRSKGLEAARILSMSGDGKGLHDQFRHQIDEIKNTELELLAKREQDTRQSTNITKAIIIAGGALGLIIASMALLIIRRDFARRQQAEIELENFFSLSLDFLCIASGDGYFKRVSPVVTDILGWSIDEFLARPFMDFIHPEEHAIALSKVDTQVVGGNKVQNFELRFLHKNGSWRILSWQSMPYKGLMYASARDVTERRHNERILREAKDYLEHAVAERTAELAQANLSLSQSERRFRALIEHGSDSVSLIDADNKILYLSPAVTAVEGYMPEELLGTSGKVLTHPDDLPLIQNIVQKLMDNPGKPIPVLWRRQHKQGHWIWLEGIATNLLHDSAVQAIVTNYRDVSERKHAENRLKAQLERLALLSQITRAIGEGQDIQNIFRVVTNTLEEQLPVDFICICFYNAIDNTLLVTSVGARSKPLAIQLGLIEQALVAVDENGLSRCVHGSLVYEPDVGVASFPFPQRLSAGGLKSMVAAPLMSESKVFGILIAVRSVANGFSSGECEFLKQLSEHVALATNQASLYSALQTAYDDLRQTQQAVMQHERLRVLGQMASGIAHDINNSISPVTLYTESLLENEPGLSERARNYLKIILRSIGDVAETVTRMREFYRTREPQLDFAEIDINSLIQQVLELTRTLWTDVPQQRGIVIQLQTDFAPALPAIMGIESEIREALTNLVINAIDAMPKGGTLTLRTLLNRSPDVASLVEVQVSDTGIGMDEETRNRCLEPFFTTKGERGTGLGLAMVYGTMQRHNADIDIESILGEGTTMRLGFVVTDTTQFTETVTRLQLVRRTGLRILIVDDDPVLLNSLRDTLESDGCIVCGAHGGQEGIDIFLAAQNTQDKFDVVVTDLGMPNIDGHKVASAIKTASATTPVIMLTGWGRRLIAEGEMPAHVDRLLGKPPKLRELHEAFAELVAK